jgi:hypothetical protein
MAASAWSGAVIGRCDLDGGVVAFFLLFSSKLAFFQRNETGSFERGTEEHIMMLLCSDF